LRERHRGFAQLYFARRKSWPQNKSAASFWKPNG
jgi:hypothetical protein